MKIENDSSISLRHIFGIILLFLVGSLDSFSEDVSARSVEDTEVVTNEIVEDFILAVNSGERNTMQKFIQQHYDQRALGRIPLFAVVSLNLGFYYETGGLGYELLEVLPSEGNQISAEIYNRLTGATLKLRIPTSGAPSYKINRFIQSELIASSTDGKQRKQWSDEEIILHLGKCLRNLEKDEEFSGTVLLAKNGDILLEEAIGMASKSYEIPNKIDTKFNIASVGKMFTGLAVTQLAEKGEVSFEDPISKYVTSEWLSSEVSEKIQIRHLLTHTSGLGDYFRDAYTQCKVPYFRDLEDYKSLIADDTLIFEPGTRFSYSNTGMLFLGVIIERITGEKYFSYLKENIFHPSGMANTDGFDKDSPVKNRATGYTKVYQNGKAGWNNHQFTRILRGSPSGGIYSTAEDLLIFAEAIRSNKLLSRKYTEILLQGRPELNASFHGYGFFNAEGAAGLELSHKGDGQGMNCHFKMFPETGYTFVVLSNYSSPSANIIANVFDQLIANRKEQ
jgi:CubicO group peptidase (beta-lactamase class C family)